MTEHLEVIFELLETLTIDERKLIIAECIRKYGLDFGVWKIELKEKNSLLFIDNKDDGHGFTFSKEGEFKII